MTPEFVKLTSRECGGGDLFLRRSMIAAVGSYWNGKQQVTHVTLINEDIDYEVKESPAEVLALISGKVPHGSLTNENQCGTIRGQRRNNHASRDRQNKGEVPAAGREAPRAVQPVVRDAAPVL